MVNLKRPTRIGGATRSPARTAVFLAKTHGGAGREGPAPPERIVLRIVRDVYWISMTEFSSP